MAFDDISRKREQNTFFGMADWKAIPMSGGEMEEEKGEEGMAKNGGEEQVRGFMAVSVPFPPSTASISADISCGQLHSFFHLDGFAAEGDVYAHKEKGTRVQEKPKKEKGITFT